MSEKKFYETVDANVELPPVTDDYFVIRAKSIIPLFTLQFDAEKKIFTDFDGDADIHVTQWLRKIQRPEPIAEEDVEKLAEKYTLKKFGEVDDFIDAMQGFIDGYTQAAQANRFSEVDMLLWISKTFDLVEGSWFWKDDTEGENTLVEKDLIEAFRNRNKFGE